ncbi:MAG: DNA mismatch repair protein MutS [Novosphingobium sp.]|uniref:Smr/MutS family protein n=1 Tax=Novosphingobium sp. TaxID=1874826 RepID=UPI0017AAE114|nr:DNA mismatch repair protein MutS [Novosphingobium sp.]
MRPPRGLSPEEAELWARVAGTVKRLHPPRNDSATQTKQRGEVRTRVCAPAPSGSPAQAPPPSLRDGPPPRHGEERQRPLDRRGLDSSWDKKLARAALHPDFTLDLHGHSLDSAHVRLDHGLAQAAAMGARLVLVITGKPRSAAAADRGTQRGAIRAKVLDWLAAGAHADRIAAVRGAHRRHGGDGALYIVMKRPR